MYCREVADDLVHALAAGAAYEARQLSHQALRHGLGLALKARGRCAPPGLFGTHPNPLKKTVLRREKVLDFVPHFVQNTRPNQKKNGA